jgi:hypothetical protein
MLQNQLSKNLKEHGDMARDMAIAELKDLKKDLLNLEKALAAKKTPDQALLMDISHGAFELFRTASIVLETDKLQSLLSESAEEGKDLEYLEQKGAKLLTKPEGWHWFSPKGEMFFLAAAGETGPAAQKLRSRLTRRRPAAAKSAPPKPPAEE